ncbi:hypothetical protein [Actinokineospora globicatena]|uniref:galactose-binding domain-containing protein n=1 Tax=Actinokineospora globicatena TaxID=103729 RepID=UPI0020A355EF|nr:hypothetical protein [Actinokineospora globicatena]MCP2306819.1 hypothetical protein [Actinokineospora globicatena]GLW82056.1 hypothetical protein Aglo01_65370 [Actinokineospora globicatena]GLW88850.1 hypothetical protein Aglo02_64890 [Actinokineospora globicatena]
MPLIARKHVPAALALISATILGVVVPTATATPTQSADPAAAALTTFPPTTTTQPSSTMPKPPCDTSTATTTTTTTTTGGPTYTGTTNPSSPSSPPNSPLLTTYPPTEPTPPKPGTNFALAGWATASSTFPGYSAHKVNDGSAATTLGCDHSWTNDVGRPPSVTPEWVQVTWHYERSVSHIVVYTSDGYPLRDFDVQVYNPNGWWDTVATYNYNTNTKVNVWFGARITRGVKILAKVGPSHQPQYARVNEIQAYAY